MTTAKHEETPRTETTNRSALRTSPTEIERSEHVQTLVPPFDVLESPDAYAIRADVPGVRAEQLQIELKDGELSIRARAQALGAGLDLLFGGRSTFEYAIRFRVPAGIDADKVNAEISNGVLQVNLPKAESRKPRQIPVRTPS